MSRGMKEKYILLGILLIAIISVSIGFASFSSNLNIVSGANVKMDPEGFNVKFSKQFNIVDEGSVIANNVGVGVTSRPGLINNDGNPSITNIHASFTDPGQSVTYHFYVLNNGLYDAYLTNINFNEVENNKITKKCVGDKWVNPELLESTCNSIAFEIQVGNISTQVSKQVSNHVLNKGSYEDVYVTIDYPVGSPRVDGKMDITFSDIELIYSSLDSSSPIPTDAVQSYSMLKQTYYAFGTPTEQSTTNYNDIPYNVMFSLYEGEKELCLKKNGNIECFKSNNKEFEVNHLKEFFGEEKCYYMGTTYYCENDLYSVSLGNAGNLETYGKVNGSSSYYCYFTANGISRCS